MILVESLLGERLSLKVIMRMTKFEIVFKIVEVFCFQVTQIVTSCVGLKIQPLQPSNIQLWEKSKLPILLCI